MQTQILKNVVPAKLGRELLAANINHNGMSQFGNVLVVLLVDENQSAQAQVVINAHDGIDTVVQRFEAAKNNVQNIPGWATWTEAQALTWWTANLSDAQVDAIANLTEAKAMIKKQNAGIKSMAQMLIAIRDRLWPNLPEG